MKQINGIFNCVPFTVGNCTLNWGYSPFMNAIHYPPHITNFDTSFDQGRTLVWLLGNRSFQATPQYLSLRCLNSLLLLRSFWKWKIGPPKIQFKGPIATVAVHLHLLWTLKVNLQTSDSFKNEVRASLTVTEWALFVGMIFLPSCCTS